ncbi:MAG TPA: hypothetical protein VIA63_06985 [Candidatus Limnocylindria bacterium]|jgi:hypothetical protein
MDHNEDGFVEDAIYELRQRLTLITGDAQRAKHFAKNDLPRATEALDRVISEVARLDRQLAILLDRARQEANAHAI